ncbi:tannase/feruloyl esterase family alpha/beta hydrolase [Novosphingobium sp. PS1R-30]|uniref:Tannase/feruloyl esterase family alpha/beta hydrolase n=1 Tax=Novosphingobium anseongense TaxID=3133436 RepID=A0ABU8S1K4_9SPHN
MASEARAKGGPAAKGLGEAAGRCAALVDLVVPASAIGLPSGGARIGTASVFSAEADLPETCRVNGAILPATPGAPQITFQINLPRAWNEKAVQFGGGGFNGFLVDGLRSLPGVVAGVADVPNPLARGFATFGSDGGHLVANPFDASFARNTEARENYMGAAVKRLHDAAVAVVGAYYGKAPRRLYYAGGSKGGHEALVAAQRYGADFDGAIAYYPAKDSVGLILGWGALTKAAYGPGGGALSPVKQAFVHRAVLAACDGLDGLADGVIANTAACEAAISPVSLACPAASAPAGDCLDPSEVAALAVASRRTVYPYPLANGVASIGPFPVLSEGSLDQTWLSAGGRAATLYEQLNNGIARNFWTNDAAAGLDRLDLAALRSVIEAHSRASDATSTDLEAFRRHGGKLILVQGTTDMLVPPAATTDYYRRLAGRYGEAVEGLARYFIQPGYGHGNGPFTLSWDSLGALDAWVETGRFPAAPVATDGNAATRGRQMPLCAYPLFARFTGGDPRAATSFRCAAR